MTTIPFLDLTRVNLVHATYWDAGHCGGVRGRVHALQCVVRASRGGPRGEDIVRPNTCIACRLAVTRRRLASWPGAPTSWRRPRRATAQPTTMVTAAVISRQ